MSQAVTIDSLASYLILYRLDEILTKQIDSWTTGESKEKDALAVIVP